MAGAVCDTVNRLSPVWLFEAIALPAALESAVEVAADTAVAVPAANASASENALAFDALLASALAVSPVVESLEFVDVTSPLVTEEPLVEFDASIEEAPDVTAPITCPPTASPVVAGADWLIVDRLLPSWTFEATAVLVASALDAALAVAVANADRPTAAVSVAAMADARASAAAVALLDRPVNDVESLTDFASPDVMSLLLVAFRATITLLPPGPVTAPMTCPPTASPLVASAVCLTVWLLSPFWKFDSVECATAAASANAPVPTIVGGSRV